MKKKILACYSLLLLTLVTAAQVDTIKQLPAMPRIKISSPTIRKINLFKTDKTNQLEFEQQKLEDFRRQEAIKLVAPPTLRRVQADVPDGVVIDDDGEMIDNGEYSGYFKNPASLRLTGPSQFDSRVEVRLLDPLIGWQQHILNNAQSVGLVVRKEHLQQITDSVYKINTGLTLRQKYNLCPGQAFADQPVAGDGTAFLISRQEMLTAGHVFSESLERYAVVFGFEMQNQVGAYEAFIPITDIYYPKQLVWKDEDLDLVAIRLDRATDRDSLTLAHKIPAVNSEVYMIGYPSGLPQKVALNARISTAGEHPHYFYTTLDAFQGNSGSPVFDFATHTVIGVLVSGEVDYTWTGSCYTTTTCRLPYCKGEKVISIGQLEEKGLKLTTD